MKVIVNESAASANEIDCDKIQLVQMGELVLLTTGKHTGDTFSGTVVVKDHIYSTGEYNNRWEKDLFNIAPSNFSITLQND